MGKILDWFFGYDEPKEKSYRSKSFWADNGYGYGPLKNTRSKNTSKDKDDFPVKPIIDPKRISMVKAHTIIGSIEKYGRASAFANLVKWLEANETTIAKNILDEYSKVTGAIVIEDEVLEESFNDLVAEARGLKTKEELTAFIKKIEDDESLSDKRYEDLRHLAIDSQYKNSSN